MYYHVLTQEVDISPTFSRDSQLGHCTLMIILKQTINKGAHILRDNIQLHGRKLNKNHCTKSKQMHYSIHLMKLELHIPTKLDWEWRSIKVCLRDYKTFAGIRHYLLVNCYIHATMATIIKQNTIRVLKFEKVVHPILNSLLILHIVACQGNRVPSENHLWGACTDERPDTL